MAVGLIVYQRAISAPITMDLGRRVMAELTTHPKGCGCGCPWARKADPVKVFRSACYWQLSAEKARRLARL
jgi:hypothetical protein